MKIFFKITLDNENNLDEVFKVLEESYKNQN